MSSQFLFRPAIRHGVAVSEQVGIPLDFQQPEAPVGSIMRGQRPLGTLRSVQGVAWTAVPSVADLAAAYPRGARERRVAGVATLSCQIRGDGSLRQCSTVSEEPRSDGFAVAARELSRLFRAPVDQPGNQALEGAYTQIRFNFPIEALDPASQVIGRPTWAQRPHAGIPGSEYPRPAVAAHITEGRVALRCIVGPDGHLTHCTPTSEDPPGYGFAQAATALATGFVMTLWTQDGLPTVGAAVNVPVHYVLPPTAPVPAPPALR